MSYFKNVDGQQIPMTEDEILEFQQREADDLSRKAQELADQYKRDRARAYPSIQDQLDLLWHAIDKGTLDKTSDFYLQLKAVKDSYPKPGV